MQHICTHMQYATVLDTPALSHFAGKCYDQLIGRNLALYDAFIAQYWLGYGPYNELLGLVLK